MPTSDIPATRQQTVDALRGFALFGILVVNLPFFAMPDHTLGVDPSVARSAVDTVAAGLVTFLFETKFYLLFSFLFGYSFHLQACAARRAGAAFVPRMLRRHAGLLALGIAHGVLLFYGDILAAYAVLGLVLLCLRDWPDRRLIGIAVGLTLLSALAWAGLAMLADANDAAPADADLYGDAARRLSAYLDSPASVVARNIDELGDMWFVTGLIQGPTAFAMFALGLVGGRRGWLDHGARSLLRAWRWLLVAGVLGLAGAAYYTLATRDGDDTARQLQAIAVGVLSAPLLSAAYVAGLSALFRTPRGARLSAWLASAGRMALSNYLMQSLVNAWIFYAYGLRLMGQVGPAGCLALAVLIFVAQLAISRWWMARFAQGPVEWGLRALTYARVPGRGGQG